MIILLLLHFVRLVVWVSFVNGSVAGLLRARTHTLAGTFVPLNIELDGEIVVFVRIRMQIDGADRAEPSRETFAPGV